MRVRAFPNAWQLKKRAQATDVNLLQERWPGQAAASWWGKRARQPSLSPTAVLCPINFTARKRSGLPIIEQHGQCLGVVVPDQTIPVDGDPIRLPQVVSNLLTNAAKYTQRGGHIEVSVARDGATAILALADDGIGITKAMLQTVSGRFTQVDRTLEQTTGGLGIGLSLAKGLVEMHGGSIEAFSEGEGKGSEFAVRLPIADSTVSASEPSGAEATTVGPVRSYRSLIVDDNVDAADSLGEILELMGNGVLKIYDKVSAINAVKAFRPSLVLCDVAMPKKNRYDAARRIWTEEWGKSIVLVALTGWGQDDTFGRAWALGSTTT